MRAALGLPPGDNDPPAWPPSRHPHQVYLMAASMVSGSVGLLGLGSPRSAQRELQPAVLWVWLATIAVCGLLGVISALLAKRDVATSLLLERVALFTIGPGALVYSLLVLSAAGWNGFYSASFVGGYGLACVVRGLQVHATVKWLHKITEERLSEEP